MKPAAKRTPGKVSWTRCPASRAKCDDCLHVLILAKGAAPVARLAKWKVRTGDDVAMVCHAHKQQRTDDNDQRGKQ